MTYVESIIDSIIPYYYFHKGFNVMIDFIRHEMIADCVEHMYFVFISSNIYTGQFILDILDLYAEIVSPSNALN